MSSSYNDDKSKPLQGKISHSFEQKAAPSEEGWYEVPCSSTVDSRVVNLYVYPLPLFDVYLGHPSVLRSLTRLLLGWRSLKKLEYFKESLVIYKYKTLVLSPTHNPVASSFLCAFLCCLQCGYLVWSFLACLWVLIPPCIKVLDQDPNSCSSAPDNLETAYCGLMCIRLMILLLKPHSYGQTCLDVILLIPWLPALFKLSC